jgi:hypothetical protein
VICEGMLISGDPTILKANIRLSAHLVRQLLSKLFIKTLVSNSS